MLHKKHLKKIRNSIPEVYAKTLTEKNLYIHCKKSGHYETDTVDISS